MNILVIDDNIVSRKILNNLLKNYGQIDEAASGLKAIEMVQKALEEKGHYDLIFLDIIMPNMDGQEVLTAIRALEKDAELNGRQRAKIVMTTSLVQMEAVQEAVQRQADGYLTKPIDREKIEAELKRLELA